MSEHTLTQAEKEHSDSLLKQLDQARSKLKIFAQEPIDELLNNEQKLDQIRYNLIISIQATIDICYHFVAKLDAQPPKNYAYCFGLSASVGIIDKALVNDLEQMAHFRNLLITGNADNELVCDVLYNKLAYLDAFEEQIQCFVDKCRPFRDNVHS